MKFIFFIMTVCLFGLSGCDKSAQEKIAEQQLQKEELRIQTNKFSGVTQVADALKIAVEVCAADLGKLTGCDAGKNGIPANAVNVGKQVASATTLAGLITVTASVTDFLNGETYVLTPEYSAGTVTWTRSGTICRVAPICK